jgi:hypothetical protein
VTVDDEPFTGRVNAISWTGGDGLEDVPILAAVPGASQNVGSRGIRYPKINDSPNGRLARRPKVQTGRHARRCIDDDDAMADKCWKDRPHPCHTDRQPQPPAGPSAMNGYGGRVGADQPGHGITSPRSVSERADGGECDEQLSSSILAAVSPGLARWLSRLRLGRGVNQPSRSVLPARADRRLHERRPTNECPASHARFDRLAGLGQSRPHGVGDLPETAATKKLQRFGQDGSDIRFGPHVLRVGWPARQAQALKAGVRNISGNETG